LSSTSQLALDRVVSLRLRVLGEVTCEESTSVCGLPGTEIHDVECVMSDIHAMSRCEEFIIQLEHRHNSMIHRLIVWDSATGCPLLQEEQTPKPIVLCTREAASLNGLTVFQEHVLTAKSQSRYTIVGRQDTSALVFPNNSLMNTAASRQRCTLIIYSAGWLDLFAVASAFRNLGILIEHPIIRSNGDEPARYVVQLGMC
jgi:prephenate dehydratase